MTRCKTLVITLLVLAALVPLVAAPHDAAASTLRSRLQTARARLSTATHHLRDARAALEAALAPTALSATTPAPAPAPSASATPDLTVTSTPSLDELRARVQHWRQAVHRLGRRVRKLTRDYRLQQQLAAWERNQQWRPIIQYAAAKYHVNADGIYRMMMRESGGRRFAGSATAFKGLFQYHVGTWAAAWNPWRHDSIYDGSSQILATCYAVHRGYGPSMWTTTYAYAF